MGNHSGTLVPFVPSPLFVVEKMLELAGAGRSDTVYDLGCGDGRIVFAAVENFDVQRAVCVEIRSDLVGRVRKEVNRRGLEDRIIVIHGDFFNVKLRDATIVTLFLLTSINELLAPKLERELRYGARVVSHEFRVGKWRPCVYATVSDGRIYHDIYLYIAPFSYTRTAIEGSRREV